MRIHRGVTVLAVTAAVAAAPSIAIRPADSVPPSSAQAAATDDDEGILIATFGDANDPTPPSSLTIDQLAREYPDVPVDDAKD